METRAAAEGCSSVGGRSGLETGLVVYEQLYFYFLISESFFSVCFSIRFITLSNLNSTFAPIFTLKT